MAYPGSSFVEPTTPGDAVSVFVLIEDSALLAAKWAYMHDFVLPVLLDTLRKADPTSPMRAFWFTTAPSSTPSTTAITGADEGIQIPDFSFEYASGSPISMAHVRRGIDILATGTGSRRVTRHLIIIAASRLRDSVMSSHTSQSGNDPWENLALSLSQMYIRLHMILSPGNETNNFHGLFKRLLQLERNTEVPVWFPVDSRLLTVRLSGKPMRPHEGIYGVPEEPASEVPPDTQEVYSSSASPPSLPSSPSSDSIGPIRRHSTPVTASRKARAPEDTSPTLPEGMGLVTYLQQMHGLTKKRSYGLKAPKRTPTTEARPGGARPILPRLEVSASTPYTYPTFNVEGRASASPTTIVSHTSMQTLESAASEERRSRRHSPWLPVRPFQTGGPTTAAPSASNPSALRSLESMARRLPDLDRRPLNPPSVPYVSAAAATTYSANAPQPGYAQAQNGTHTVNYSAAASSPASPPSSEPSPSHMSSAVDADWRLADPAMHPHPHPHAYAYTGVPYSTSPISSTSTASLPSPGIAPPAPEPAVSMEDAPFVITAEYEALANARFEEAVRSGALQASMTVSTPVPAAASAPISPALTDPLPRQELYPVAMPQYPQYPAAPQLHAQPAGEQRHYEPVTYMQPPPSAAPEWNAPMTYTHAQQVPQYGPSTWYGP
ncbi:hypothetical protein CERSUDRAFT_69524 [Gelatoporia subvermispora B]|uniref:Uncharacterized protein n=1 Tax=Ceriporiopsis subvermispora (strain B) TaxID=914234 RepID=M2Q317_CERS8|nr:hypothetical protein CERSUDRAFT_69524 [Gelatoporia subvermispora B]